MASFIAAKPPHQPDIGRQQQNLTMTDHQGFMPFHSTFVDDKTMLERATAHFMHINSRRTLRMFSPQPVARDVIEQLILTASTAPSGAHKQPWTFCAISDPDTKHRIRLAAEAEERINYQRRMGADWIHDLKPFGTDEHKPFLEIAPWLIVVMKRPYEVVNEQKMNNYYVSESVGIACGFLLQAIHQCGLVALTHTPSPMTFLTKVLNRPENERPFLLIPVGYPATNAEVPILTRKALDEIAVFY